MTMPYLRRRALALASGFAFALHVYACSSTPAQRPRLNDEIIRVASDNWNFQGATSHTIYVPVGVNYDVNTRGPCAELIEEYWEARWSEVETDFQRMADFGFNVVRIHLQLPSFMTGPASFDNANLQRLDALVALAQERGLKLLI